jgi:C1A family cysteine protease
MRLSDLIFLSFILFASVAYGDNWVIRYLDAHKNPENLTGLKMPSDWPEQVSRSGDNVIPSPNLPQHWDWREHGTVRDARNQGACGSCWAFATDGVSEIVWQLQHKGEQTTLLGPQALLDCSGSGCGGGWFNAFDYIQNSGLPLEGSYPYKAFQNSCRSYAPAQSITRWSYIGDGSAEPTVEQLKQAIYDHGPIAVVVGADSGFMRYKNGIFNGCNYSQPNHMVILTGWQASPDKNGHWYLLNSWGTAWGEKGYMRIPYYAKGSYKCNSLGQVAAYAVVDGVENLRTFLGIK